MKLLFDGQEFLFEDSTKTIVELAKENGIYISAPCYYKTTEHGCCKGCLILVNGKEAYACETKPEDGMEIIYDEKSLVMQRRRNIARYNSAQNPDIIAKNKECGHSHTTHHCNGSCSSGGGCDCGSH